MPETKTITLRFEIPATVDTPSETLADMKMLLLEALRVHANTFHLSESDRRLVEALLTES